jgi:uncharacterized protein
VKIFLKTILLVITLFLFMYAITAFAGWAWKIEIRGPWSMFKVFTRERAVEFWKYLWFPMLFWIFNAGVWLFGMMRQKEYGSEIKTILIWWLKACFAMLTGLIILNLLSYLPMAFGWSGPLMNQFLFAPMMLLQTWASIPITAVFLLIAIVFFRKTGKIYLGSILIPILVTWLLVTGTVNF